MGIIGGSIIPVHSLVAELEFACLSQQVKLVALALYYIDLAQPAELLGSSVVEYPPHDVVGLNHT